MTTITLDTDNYIHRVDRKVSRRGTDKGLARRQRTGPKGGATNDDLRLLLGEGRVRKHLTKPRGYYA